MYNRHLFRFHSCVDGRTVAQSVFTFSIEVIEKRICVDDIGSNLDFLGLCFLSFVHCIIIGRIHLFVQCSIVSDGYLELDQFIDEHKMDKADLFFHHSDQPYSHLCPFGAS